MSPRQHVKAARYAEREGNAAERLGDHYGAAAHFHHASCEYRNASTAYFALAIRLAWIAAVVGVIAVIVATAA